MGLTLGTWLLTPSFSHANSTAIVSAIADRLRAITELRVDQAADGCLSLPAIRESLFDWEVTASWITVYSFLPAHPYLWENLDAAMTALGMLRDARAHTSWSPRAEHHGLRKRWSALSRRDRFLLSLPSVMAARPQDRFLSG